MPRLSFAKKRHELALAKGPVLLLEPPDKASADDIARTICRLDPWLTLKTKPEHVAALLTRNDAHFCRLIVRYEGAIAGAVVVRSPWLYGPYLNLLAVLPAYQHMGIGTAILGWMADEAGATAGNLWVCVSEFNARAIRFYERHGFDQAGRLPDLVSPGFTEFLLRKRLPGAEKSAARET
jgi:ribosomal protein S18 acetylase RimI-like enzyme